MNLKIYLKELELEFTVKEILGALCDGEFLGKFDVTQTETEELHDYYNNKIRDEV